MIPFRTDCYNKNPLWRSVSPTTEGTPPNTPEPKQSSQNEAFSPCIGSNPADKNLELFQTKGLLSESGNVNREIVPKLMPPLTPSCIYSIDGLFKKPGTICDCKGKTLRTTLEDFFCLIFSESKNKLWGLPIKEVEMTGKGLPSLLESSGYFDNAMQSLGVKPHNISNDNDNQNLSTKKFEILISVDCPLKNSFLLFLTAIWGELKLDFKIESRSSGNIVLEYSSMSFQTETDEIITVKITGRPCLPPDHLLQGNSSHKGWVDQSIPLGVSVKEIILKEINHKIIPYSSFSQQWPTILYDKIIPYSSLFHQWQPIFNHYTKTPCFPIYPNQPVKNYLRLMHEYTLGLRCTNPRLSDHLFKSFHKIQKINNRCQNQYIANKVVEYIIENKMDRTAALTLTYQTCLKSNLGNAACHILWKSVIKHFHTNHPDDKHFDDPNDFLKLVADLVTGLMPFTTINSLVEIAGYIHLHTMDPKSERNNAIRFETIRQNQTAGMHVSLPSCSSKLLLPIRPKNSIKTLQEQSKYVHFFLEKLRHTEHAERLWTIYDMLTPLTPVKHPSDSPTIQHLIKHELLIINLDQVAQELANAPQPLLRHLGLSLACVNFAQSGDLQPLCNLLLRAPYPFSSEFSHSSQKFLAMSLDEVLPLSKSSLSLTEKLECQEDSAVSKQSFDKHLIESFSNCVTPAESAYRLWKNYVNDLNPLPIPNEMVEAGLTIFRNLIRKRKISCAIWVLSDCQRKQFLSDEKQLELLTMLCETCTSSKQTNEIKMNLDVLGEKVLAFLNSHRETKPHEETPFSETLLKKLIFNISDSHGPDADALTGKLNGFLPSLDFFDSQLEIIDNAIRRKQCREAWTPLEELIRNKKWPQGQVEKLRERAHAIINLALEKEVNPPQETNKKKKKGASHFNSVNLRETTEFVLRIHKGVSSLEPKKPSLEMQTKLLGSLLTRLKSEASHQTVDRMYHDLTRQTVQLARDLLDNDMKVPPELSRRCENAHYSLLNYYKQAELAKEAVPCILALSNIVRPTHWNPGILDVWLWAAKATLMQDPITSQNAEDTIQIIDLAKNTKKLSNHLHQAEQAAIYCRLALHFLREDDVEKGFKWLDRLLCLKRGKGFLSSINYNDLLELATLCYEKGNDVDKTIMLLQLLKEIPSDPSSEGPSNLIVKLAKNKPQKNLIFFGEMLVEYHTVLRTAKEYEAIRENAKYVLTTLLNGKLKNTSTYFNVLISLLTTFEITEGHLWKSTLSKANNPKKKQEAWTSWKKDEENNLVQYQSNSEHLECWGIAVQILMEMRHTGIFYVLDKLEDINALEGEDNQALVSKIREKLLLGCLGLFQGNKTPPSLTGQRLESLISLRDSFPSTNNIELPLLKALSESCNPYYLGICCNRLLSVFKDEDSSTIHSHLATLTPELISRISKVEGKPSPELKGQAVSVSEQARETLKMSHNDCIHCAESLLEMSTAEATLESTWWTQKSLDLYEIPKQQKGSKRKGQKKNNQLVIVRKEVNSLFDRLISHAELGETFSCLETCLDHPNASAILTSNQYSALWGRIIDKQMRSAIENKECSKEDMVAIHKLFCDHFDSFKNKPELVKKLFLLDTELNIEIFRRHENDPEGMKKRHIESYSILDFTPEKVQSMKLSEKEELKTDPTFKLLANLPFLVISKYIKATVGENTEKEEILSHWAHDLIYRVIDFSFSPSGSLPVFTEHSLQTIDESCKLCPHGHKKIQIDLLLKALKFLKENYDSKSYGNQKEQFTSSIQQLSRTIHDYIPTLEEEIDNSHIGKLLNSLYFCISHGSLEELLELEIFYNLHKQFSIAYQTYCHIESQVDLYCEAAASLIERSKSESSESQKKQFSAHIKLVSDSIHHIIPMLICDVEDNHIGKLLNNLYDCILHGIELNLLLPETFHDLFEKFTFAYLAEDEELYSNHLTQASSLFKLGSEKEIFMINKINMAVNRNRSLTPCQICSSLLYYKTALYLGFNIPKLQETVEESIALVLVSLITEKSGIENPFVLNNIINLLNDRNTSLLEKVEDQLIPCYQMILSTIMKSPMDSKIGMLIHLLLTNLQGFLETNTKISVQTKKKLITLIVRKFLEHYSQNCQSNNLSFHEIWAMLEKIDLLLQSCDDSSQKECHLFCSCPQEYLSEKEQELRAIGIHSWFSRLYNLVDDSLKPIVLTLQIDLNKKTNVYLDYEHLLHDVLAKKH